MLGCSDAHVTVQSYIDPAKGEHRTMTLVFAKERTAESIREALDNRRTAVYWKDFILGEEQWIRPILEKSLVVRSITLATPAPGSSQGRRCAIVLKNNSGLVFHLKKIVPGVKPVYLREYTVKPHGQTTIDVGPPDETGSSEVLFQITNFLTTPETPLAYIVKIPANIPARKP